MEPITVRILLWLAAFVIAWFAARAALSVLKSEKSDSAKATWIAIIVCTPIIGPIIYWLCTGGDEFSKESPEAREALLKARLNRNIS
jgi:hypothetical protein